MQEQAEHIRLAASGPARDHEAIVMQQVHGRDRGILGKIAEGEQGPLPKGMPIAVIRLQNAQSRILGNLRNASGGFALPGIPHLLALRGDLLAAGEVILRLHAQNRLEFQRSVIHQGKTPALDVCLRDDLQMRAADDLHVLEFIRLFQRNDRAQVVADPRGDVVDSETCR